MFVENFLKEMSGYRGSFLSPRRQPAHAGLFANPQEGLIFNCHHPARVKHTPIRHDVQPPRGCTVGFLSDGFNHELIRFDIPQKNQKLAETWWTAAHCESPSMFIGRRAYLPSRCRRLLLSLRWGVQAMLGEFLFFVLIIIV